MLALARAEGVPVLAYDRLIEMPGVFYLSFDNVEVGRIQAREILRARPEGRFAFIKGAATVRVVEARVMLLRLGFVLRLHRLSAPLGAHPGNAIRRLPLAVLGALVDVLAAHFSIDIRKERKFD